MAPSPRKRLSNFLNNASRGEKLATFGAAVVLLIALGSATGVLDFNKSTGENGKQLYTAQMEYTIRNPLIGGPRVTTMNVHNFEKQGTFSVGSTKQFILASQGTAEIEAICNGETVYSASKSFKVELRSSVDTQIQLENLPAGESCNAQIELIQDGNVINTESVSFSVPS